MPLVVVTGLPSSGKTRAANELRDFFRGKDKKVHVVGEGDVLASMKLRRDEAYADSGKEKEIRSVVKSSFARLVGPEDLVIVDALNYIKGYRYELYCLTKSAKTTQCTLHCQTGRHAAWEYNLSREGDRYSKEVFDGLCLRYEAPDGRNRWDSPLLHLASDGSVPLGDVFEALYCRRPPPPNQSTQCPPVSDTNFLHRLDAAAQEVISSVVSSQKLNLEGEVAIPGCDERFLLSGDRNASLPQLLRLKRQFLSYVKLHPTLYNDGRLKELFVQYLNANL